MDLATDTWERMPELNYPRYYHSSCILGNIMYVYRGDLGRNYIEMLQIAGTPT